MAIAALFAALGGATIAIVAVSAGTPNGASASATTSAGLTTPTSGPLTPEVACGVKSTSTAAAVDEAAARLIYSGELGGTETRADIGHITTSSALLSALAENNQAAVQSAVHALVYAPAWHIVRLRVLKAGRVVSDIGGPYIIAPVTGTLTWHGKTVGQYVMSVQDDVGYVKLETRFVGIPVEIYRNGSPLMGTVSRPPRSITNGQAVGIAGASYQARVMDLNAFPTGKLQVALMVPKPGPAAQKQSCATIRLTTWGSIAKDIAARFSPLAPHYKDLVSVLRATTGFRAYVTVGSQRVAGEIYPRKLPASGSVSLVGRSWSMFSWSPAPGVRIYLLTSP